MEIELQRNNNGINNSLLGQFFLFGQQIAVTIENKELSIPAGQYSCIPHNSPKHPDTWEISNEPDRTEILIHNANLASQLLGCVAPGNTYGTISGENAVMNSVVTMDKLRKLLPDYFTLIVKDVV
jgi:hypothetical protein